VIELALGRRRKAMAIWQDLVDQHGFPARHASVRFVGTLRGPGTPDAHPVIVTAPGEDAQVDYGEEPMMRQPVTGKYRRTRLFVLTLAYSARASACSPSSRARAAGPNCTKKRFVASAASSASSCSMT
jgi:hypothetical protein